MSRAAKIDLSKLYDPGEFFCEMLGGPEHPSEHTAKLWQRIGQMGLKELRARAKDAETELFSFGITFTVYTQKDVIDRILPFDVIPRVISAETWARTLPGPRERANSSSMVRTMRAS